jgi:hypothetical protein
MGTNPDWPNRNGSAGGVDASGTAMRHTPETEPAKQGFGWVPPAASGSNPGGGGYIPIGPSSSLWRKPFNGPYTTGDQSRGRKR